MGILKALDRFANGGPRSAMPPELLTTRKEAAQGENLRNHLAQVAANPGAARTARKAAKQQLADSLGGGRAGEEAAERRIKEADHKVKDSFRRSRGR